MLLYNYVYDGANHRVVIGSDALQNNVAIYINGTFSKFVNPNLLRKGVGAFSYSKNFLHNFNVLENLHSGTIIEYSDQRLDSLIFNELTYIHVKNGDGNYLHRNPANENEYEWHANDKTKFFFNPYFWDCRHLWEKITGYVPTNVTNTNQWPNDLAIAYFSKRTLTITDTWVGWQTINTIDPITIDRFTNQGSGTSITYELSHLIDLGATDGDEILLINGKQRLSFTYNPII